MVFCRYTKEKIMKRRVGLLINDEICKLRDELNKSILEGKDYDTIYKLSVELDILIAKFYQEKSKPLNRIKNKIARLLRR